MERFGEASPPQVVDETTYRCLGIANRLICIIVDELRTANAETLELARLIWANRTRILRPRSHINFTWRCRCRRGTCPLQNKLRTVPTSHPRSVRTEGGRISATGKKEESNLLSYAQQQRKRLQLWPPLLPEHDRVITNKLHPSR